MGEGGAERAGAAGRSAGGDGDVYADDLRAQSFVYSAGGTLLSIDESKKTAIEPIADPLARLLKP